MNEQIFNLNLPQSGTPDKRILWLVQKGHQHRISENAGRISDFCITWHTELFHFSGERIDITMLVCCDVALDTQRMDEKAEQQPKRKSSVWTEVKIQLIDSPEGINPDLYPGMDITIADQGDFCKMIKNRFGELKKFAW